MTERETILNAVKAALSPIEEPKELPNWDINLPTSKPAVSLKTDSEKVDLFIEQLSGVNGHPVVGVDGLANYLADQNLTFGYCVPEWISSISEALKSIQFSDSFDRENVNQYEIGISVASGGIAETGTIILKDSETHSRLSALAPWIHVAILSRSKIVPTVTDAVQSFGQDPSIVFITGPSKTADIEGILIEGVHGPGIQVCCLVD